MADFEQTLRELFGDSLSRLTQFQQEQVSKVSDKIREIAREATHDEVARLSADVADLKKRIAELEAERIATANEEL